MQIMRCVRCSDIQQVCRFISNSTQLLHVGGRHAVTMQCYLRNRKQKKLNYNEVS